MQQRTGSYVAIAAIVFILAAITACDASMLKCIDATCRVSAPDGGRGSGVVFAIDDYVWVLTNDHVATGTTAMVEFWRAGHQSRKVPGRVTWRSHRADAAIIAIDAKVFGDQLPGFIPLAPASLQMTKGDAVTSVGCPNGGWPTSWKGHVTGRNSNGLYFIPLPANGRSGSAIFDSTGTKIVGLLRARDAMETNGVATEVSTLYDAFRERNASTCTPDSCFPKEWKFQPVLPYRQQQQKRDQIQDEAQGGLYPTMPKQVQGTTPRIRPMVPVDLTPITSGIAGLSSDHVQLAESIQAIRDSASGDCCPPTDSVTPPTCIRCGELEKRLTILEDVIAKGWSKQTTPAPINIEAITRAVITKLPPVKMEIQHPDGTVFRQAKPLGEAIRIRLVPQ